MGLTGNNLNRFRQRVDAVLDDAFPVELIIGGRSVFGSGPGGKTMTDFINGGESKNFRFPFRIPANALETPLEVGDSLQWKISVTRSIDLEVTDFSERPHEARVAITCKKRRV